MGIKEIKEMTPGLLALVTLILLSSTVISLTVLWYVVPLIWDAIVISAKAIWSVFVYWNNKTSYVGAVSCFLTVWAGITVLPLTLTDTYIKHRRCLLITTMTLAVINTLFCFAFVAAAGKSEYGVWTNLQMLTALFFPVIAMILISQHWNPNKKIAKYGH